MLFLKIILLFATLPIIYFLVNQVRKPTRWIGQPIVWLMNKSHAGLTDWGLAHMTILEQFIILDVGCGGGNTIKKLAMRAPKGKIYGIDYSKGSISVACKVNSELINSGRVEIKQALVSQLPFPKNTFDIVTAIETHYYWPDLAKDIQEIRRVLKPGGIFIIIAESYKKGKHDIVQKRVMKILDATHFTLDEHKNLLSNAGYTDVKIFENSEKGWMCAVSKKSGNDM